MKPAHPDSETVQNGNQAHYTTIPKYKEIKKRATQPKFRNPFPSDATPSPFLYLRDLGGARIDDGGLLGVLDGTAGGAGSLKSLDNAHGLLIGNLAEDDVAAIEPRGLDSGDEELRAVAVRGVKLAPCCCVIGRKALDIRVGTSISHGEETRAGVLLHEVLIGELLAVDGLATSALLCG